MVPAFFTMTCLEFILDKINPLGFLHPNVEGWETYALRGAEEAIRDVDDTCFVVCEVWDKRDRNRRYTLDSCTSTCSGGRPTTSMGTERHSAVSTIPASLYVRCGIRGIGRGDISLTGTSMDPGLPETTSSPSGCNILTSSGTDDIVDQDRNLCFRFRGWNIREGVDGDDL